MVKERRPNLCIRRFCFIKTNCPPCSRIFGSLLAGLVAGILGITGWIGFSFYFAAHILVRTIQSRSCLLQTVYSLLLPRAAFQQSMRKPYEAFFNV